MTASVVEGSGIRPSSFPGRTCPVWRLAVAIVAMALSACAAGMDRNELLRQLQEGTQPVIVDVRSRGEFERDHIPGALSLPLFSVSSGLNAAGMSKKEPIVLYCEHGPRASLAALSLSLSGYEKIYSLEGHMRGWRKAEFPLEITVH